MNERDKVKSAIDELQNLRKEGKRMLEEVDTLHKKAEKAIEEVGRQIKNVFGADSGTKVYHGGYVYWLDDDGKICEKTFNMEIL